MRKANIPEIINTLQNVSLPNADVTGKVATLKNRYDEPWRYYHNFEHPQEMFSIFLDNRSAMQHLGAVAWAIMYHDAIYDPTAEHGRNEELSALLAERELPGLVDDDTLSRTVHYIRETVSHSDNPSDSDLNLFMDIDLAILGSETSRYRRYAADVRREYAHVPDDLYTAGRIHVLQSLASSAISGGIYRTDMLASKYQAAAQANINGEIARLSASL